ncbi:hypothetical protein EFQ99_21905 [Rhizobium vallis]|uniref:Uncharacterized protein n=1 Tax=Rhizobium vallis TaxID=634290 RepID=A0A3S0Y3L3_9HYPH|nr:hypothetical protein EFQ99_21905 [Rhizobium vallis]
MFLRHDPSSLCDTTGAPLVVARSVVIPSALREILFGREGIEVDLLSNFAPLHSGASRQPA